MMLVNDDPRYRRSILCFEALRILSNELEGFPVIFHTHHRSDVAILSRTLLVRMDDEHWMKTTIAVEDAARDLANEIKIKELHSLYNISTRPPALCPVHTAKDHSSGIMVGLMDETGFLTDPPPIERRLSLFVIAATTEPRVQ